MGMTSEAASAYLQEILDSARTRRPQVKQLRPQRIRTSEVVPEHVEFIWPGRIARGKFTIVDGDPGLGKSTMLLDIAARLSTGGAMPLQVGMNVPEGVVILSCEDGLADTIVPRLTAAGADLRQIEVFNNLIDDDGTPIPIAIPDHISYLEEAVLDMNAGLVIVDPLVAYLGGQIDDFRDSHVRRALSPLVQMAERTGTAVVAVRHPNKSGGRAIHRGGGSIGIIGASRTALYVARDPEDEESSILAVTKTNVGAQPDAMKFRLVAAADVEIRKLHWMSAVGLTAEDLIQMEDANKDVKDALIEAMNFLRELLRYGRVPLDEIRAEAKQRGIEPGDIKKAKRRLAVVEYKSNIDHSGATSCPTSTPTIRATTYPSTR